MRVSLRRGHAVKSDSWRLPYNITWVLLCIAFLVIYASIKAPGPEYIPGQDVPEFTVQPHQWASLLIGACLLVLLFISFSVWRFRDGLAPLLVVYLVVGFVVIVASFSTIYLLYGTAGDFAFTAGKPAIHQACIASRERLRIFSPCADLSTVPILTRLDATWLAVGTLTTAGAGITPISEWGRELVTAQELIDLLFIGFILAIAASRIAGSRAFRSHFRQRLRFSISRGKQPARGTRPPIPPEPI